MAKLTPTQILNLFDKTTSTIKEIDTLITDCKAEINSRELLLKRTVISLELAKKELPELHRKRDALLQTKNNLIPFVSDCEKQVRAKSKLLKELEKLEKKTKRAKLALEFLNR